MKLYLIYRIEYADWDYLNSFVIAAPTPAKARKIAEAQHIGVAAGTWLSPSLTTIVQLSNSVNHRVKEGVVMESSNGR